MGELDDEVIDAIRREHAAVERSGPVSRRVEVKSNLGSALLNMANAATNPAEYVRMYKESEELLLAALKLEPLHTDAKANLAAVRKNLKIRPGVDEDADGAVRNDFAKRVNSHGDDGENHVEDEDDQACTNDHCAENIMRLSCRFTRR